MVALTSVRLTKVTLTREALKNTTGLLGTSGVTVLTFWNASSAVLFTLSVAAKETLLKIEFTIVMLTNVTFKPVAFTNEMLLKVTLLKVTLTREVLTMLL